MKHEITLFYHFLFIKNPILSLKLISLELIQTFYLPEIKNNMGQNIGKDKKYKIVPNEILNYKIIVVNNTISQ